VLRQFIRGLNRSQNFDWNLPPSFAFPRCKIATTPQDRVKKRRHFTLDELETIWRYAKPWERALILLALNCGFSKREIATLQQGEVVKGKNHTFVKRHRTKTDVYGEWVLWSETVAALEYLKQFQKPDSPFVVINRAGTSLTRETRGGNENQVIKNHWDNLFKRIHADDRNFYKLPFKHLRKTGATLIRHVRVPSAAEMASMYLAHGEKADSADQLLPAYTVRSWKKLHKVLLRLRVMVLPMLSSVEKPWEYHVARISPSTVTRVKELRQQGKTLAEIAQEVGLHWVTVGKLCREK
jgi:integrase